MNCSNEASEEDHHHHHHVHGHGDHHTHPHGDPPIPTNVSQSLYTAIDTSKLVAYNLLNPQQELPQLFKDVSHRDDTTPVFHSEYGPELIVVVPFTGSVKAFSVLVRCGPSVSPTRVRVFKNSPQLTFEALPSKTPAHVCEHPAEEAAGHWVEHHLPRRKFAGTTSLTLVLDAPAADESARLEIFALEIRGDFAGTRSRAPVGILYESAARREDHPVEGVGNTSAGHSVL